MIKIKTIPRGTIIGTQTGGPPLDERTRFFKCESCGGYFNIFDFGAALEAFDRYGKGNQHPAQLNLGDCFAYAQAKLSGAALLFKGEDFSKTDIESAS